MKTKICTGCSKEKTLDQFYKHKDGKFDVRSKCKDCIKKESKIYYKQNKQQKLIQQKDYRDNNKQKISKCQKQHYIRNKEKILKNHKKYRDNNKEYFKEYNKKWKKDNMKNILKKEKDKKKTDIRYKILCNLRTQINMSLSNNIKSLSTMFLIGCEVDYLMYHLQKQFKSGMSWDNYRISGWEIDHIKTCALFDLSKSSEQRKCFHFSNLQPLWAEENRIKGKKY